MLKLVVCEVTSRLLKVKIFSQSQNPGAKEIQNKPVFKQYVEICALLGYYAALSGRSVPTFRDNLSAPSLRCKKSRAS
jgi:hypothetical protein